MAVEVSSKTIPVEHMTLVCSDSFADVRRRLDETVPRLDMSIAAKLDADDWPEVGQYERSGPKLSIFLERDHGALLESFGGMKNIIQYEIGNPLTAAKMTRYRQSAGLYAPLRVVLYENETGRAVIEYDKPSSLFGQFKDERVAEVGRYLDHALEATLNRATS